MNWCVSYRTDPIARVIADRHYNRQHIGADGFVPPGRCFVLLKDTHDAIWVTSWPFAQYVKHAWAGAWVNSAFRNESRSLSSDLIRQAISATRAKMSGKRPTVTISAMDECGRVLYWHNHKLKRSSVEIFRRDWR